MVKRILNPTTGRYYAVRQKTTAGGTAGQIMGLWSPKRTVAKRKVTTSKRENYGEDKMKKLTPTVTCRGEIYRLAAWEMTDKEAWDKDQEYRKKGYATSLRVIDDDYLKSGTDKNALYVRYKNKYTDATHRWIKLKKNEKWSIKSKTHPGVFYISWFYTDPESEAEVFCSNCGNIESNEFDDLMSRCGSCGGIFGPDEEFINENLEPLSDAELRKWCLEF